VGGLELLESVSIHDELDAVVAGMPKHADANMRYPVFPTAEEKIFPQRYGRHTYIYTYIHT
jgi:hypothetical protein